MKLPLRSLLFALVLCAITFARLRAEPTTLDVFATNDTTLMPYRLEVPVSYQRLPSAPRILHHLLPYTCRTPLDRSSPLLHAYNTDAGNAVIGIRKFPGDIVLDDSPLNATVRDMAVVCLENTEGPSTVLAAYRQDSAFVYRRGPAANNDERRFLASGSDATGDNQWTPGLAILATADYDHDGATELFVYLNSDRDSGPKRLYCLDGATLESEWELDVAATITDSEAFHVAGLSETPAVAFICGNHGHGRHDTNYNDNLAYFSVVDSDGKLVTNAVCKAGSGPSWLTPAASPGQYYLIHDMPPFPASDTHRVSVLLENPAGHQGPTMLSRIDLNGNTLQSVVPPVTPQWARLLPAEVGRRQQLLVGGFQGVLMIYDSMLTLQAISPPTTVGMFLDTMTIGNLGMAYVFSDGLYTTDLVKQAHFPITCEYTFPVEHNGARNHLALVNRDAFAAITLVERSLGERLAVIYVRHQLTILTILSGLIVGTIVFLLFWLRTRSNLATIAQQKAELERTHAELRDAQQKLLAAEKFRQARDIAGGFAHEIRNALFPADALLDKLIKSIKTGRPAHPDIIRRTRQAVQRGIGITKLILSYTHLEKEVRLDETTDLSDIVHEVAQANRSAIEHKQVRLELSVPDGLTISIGRQHAFMVFDNLMRNSLDALAQTTGPTITVTARAGNGITIVSFTDNGPGIPPDEQERIFDTFFTTKPSSGTGLGLTVVRRVLELYDGSIILQDSGSSAGTAFTITLKRPETD